MPYTEHAHSTYNMIRRRVLALLRDPLADRPGMRPPPGKTPIHSLFDDILSEIFIEIRSDIWVRDWYKVLWVCRRWSAIGRTTPMLWKDIVVTREPNIHFVETSLKNSGSCSLDVKLSNMQDLSRTLSLFSAHLFRLRRLTIDGVHNTKESALRALLRQKLPSLEELELSLTSPVGNLMLNLSLLYGSSEDIFVWEPHIPNYPRLVHLSLGPGVCLPRLLPVFHAVRKLEFSEHCFRPGFTLCAFLHYIEQCHNLKELILENSRLALKPASRRFTFPASLSIFDIVDEAVYIRSFLASFLVVPPHVRLSLMRLPDSSIFDPRNTPDTYIRRMLPGGNPEEWAGHIPALVRTTSVEIAGLEDTMYMLIGRVLPRSEPPLVTLTGSLPAGRDILNIRYFDDVMNIFSGAALVELRITAYQRTFFALQGWERILDAYDFEHIAVEASNWEGVFDARIPLLEALRCNKWTKLRKLTLETSPEKNDYEYEVELFRERLANCLQFRMKSGVKVDELHLVVRYYGLNVDWPEYNDATRESLQSTFQPLVNTLRVDFVKWLFV